MIYWNMILATVSGLIVGLLADRIKRCFDRKDSKRHARALLSLVAFEAREGVHRCELLVKMREEKKESFSRIYTAAWDSARPELSEYCQTLKAPNTILELLHRIYYRFDLVNFNMEQQHYGSGGAFAAQYLDDMQTNLCLLENELRKQNVALPVAGQSQPSQQPQDS